MLAWYATKSASKHNAHMVLFIPLTSYGLFLELGTAKVILISVCTKQKFIIALGSGNSPLLRNEFPLAERTRLDYLLLLDVLHQVIAQILVGRADDALLQLVLRDARAFRQQFPAAVAAIGVQGYRVHLVHVERGAVCHAEDGYLTAARLRDVYRVDDARGGIEIETEVLEGSPVRSAFAGLVAKQQDVVVGRSHAVGP